MMKFDKRMSLAFQMIDSEANCHLNKSACVVGAPRDKYWSSWKIQSSQCERFLGVSFIWGNHITQKHSGDGNMKLVSLTEDVTCSDTRNFFISSRLVRKTHFSMLILRRRSFSFRQIRRKAYAWKYAEVIFIRFMNRKMLYVNKH